MKTPVTLQHLLIAVGAVVMYFFIQDHLLLSGVVSFLESVGH